MFNPHANVYFVMHVYSVIYNIHAVNSTNCGHFGTQASVLYSGVRVVSSPICVVITVITDDYLILKYLEILFGVYMPIKHLDSRDSRR